MSDILDELRGSTDLDLLVSEVLFEGVPWIFQGDRRAFLVWKTTLSSLLGIDSHSLMIVGSAATGVSLNPDKGLRAFHARSDVDIAVVSPRHFDEAWRSLRTLGSDRYGLSSAAKAAVRSHERGYVFRGTIATDKILTRLPFARTWYPALAGMAQVDPTKGRSIKARLYRDIEALREYQRGSFALARASTGRESS